MAVQEVSFILKRLTVPVSDDREHQRKENNKALARLLAKSSSSNPLPAMGKLVQMVSHALYVWVMSRDLYIASGRVLGQVYIKLAATSEPIQRQTVHLMAGSSTSF